jgi:hypothetical protein
MQQYCMIDHNRYQLLASIYSNVAVQGLYVAVYSLAAGRTSRCSTYCQPPSPGLDASCLDCLACAAETVFDAVGVQSPANPSLLQRSHPHLVPAVSDHVGNRAENTGEPTQNDLSSPSDQTHLRQMGLGLAWNRTRGFGWSSCCKEPLVRTKYVRAVPSEVSTYLRLGE